MIENIRFALIVFACIFIQNVVIIFDNNIKWQKFLIKESHAQYDAKTGKFKLMDTDIVLFEVNHLDQKAEKLQIKINDYLKKLEDDVDKFQKTSETILKGVKK